MLEASSAIESTTDWIMVPANSQLQIQPAGPASARFTAKIDAIDGTSPSIENETEKQVKNPSCLNAADVFSSSSMHSTGGGGLDQPLPFEILLVSKSIQHLVVCRSIIWLQRDVVME